MNSFPVQGILKVTRGRLLQEGAEAFDSVSIDTRTLKRGALFIALKGKRFDGHDFVREAVGQGAAGLLVSKDIAPPSQQLTVIRVPDTLEALGAIAGWHRRRFSLPVIAVTGSNGKTTTKEMIAHLLAQAAPVLKSEGTQNNRVGVPLALLRLETSHRFLVLELGMSKPGEIRILSKIASPTVGVITNIGPAHLAFLKDLKTVFECKMELTEGLQKKGILVLNRDDPYLRTVTSRKHRVVFFGKGDSCEKTLRESLTLLGEHQIQNALAAATVGEQLGKVSSSVIEAFKHFKGLPGRLQLKRIGGLQFIDDTYNANPESARRALETLAAFPAMGKRIAVLGDMLELGETSFGYHAEIGKKAASFPIDFLVTVGPFSRHTHDAFRTLRQEENASFHAASIPEAVSFLSGRIAPGDCILVKGSRGMQMEKFIQAFEMKDAIPSSLSA